MRAPRITLTSIIRSIAFLLALFAAYSFAAEPHVLCFGNEPSWGLEFVEEGAARLSSPDLPPSTFQGSAARLDFLKEWTWRGKRATGTEGDLVAFFREATCSDGMSDTKHPVIVRVSLPDGRFLAGCCRLPSPAAAVMTPHRLEGRTWRLAGIGGRDPDPSGSASRPLTVRFDAGRIDGYSGCNQLVGSYHVEGNRVTVGALAGTMMACPDAATKLENAVREGLAGTLQYAIVDDRLTMTSAAGIELAFAAEPAPTLQGVTWTVTGFNNGRHAVVSPLVGTTLTASFRAGQVEGISGCNGYRASYRVDGNRLAIDAIAVTRKACAGEGVMVQEREFLAALRSANVWDVRGGMLDIHRADGERVLNATGSSNAGSNQ